MKAYMDSISYDYITENCISDLTGLIEVDMGIATVISMLNKKGYHTHSCSEGYIRKMSDGSSDEIVIPHIVFDFDVTLPSLPESWQMTKCEIEGVKNWTRVKGTTIAIQASSVMVAGREIEFEIVKHMALADLAAWVNDLPYDTTLLSASSFQ